MVWKKIGKVGVDSGTLMITDPAYQKDLPNYYKLVGYKEKPRKDFRIIKKGLAVTFTSGLGDGIYEVEADIGKVDGFGKRVRAIRMNLVPEKSLRIMKKLAGMS